MRLIAAFICVVGIWLLFRLNREEGVRTSKALWLPAFWLFVASSRNVGEWLHYNPSDQTDRYLEGNPLDRTILSALIAIGLVVLISRGRQVGILLKSNFPILLFFFYCGISVAWSDYPDVSFKRWFRALGDVVMILIVLSDSEWLAAVKRLFSRVGFVVVPVSILFIRYFPELGRAYSRNGRPTWTGVGTDKNALGMICLVFGLAALFQFLQLRKAPEGERRKGPIFAQGALVVMTFYLLWQANSATAFACFFLAGGVLTITQIFAWSRKPTFLRVLTGIAIIVPMSAMFLGIGSSLLGTIGRDSTFTGRTAIWQAALPLVSNPIFGAGYESFWLGPRLKAVETAIGQGLNQAHNGYIEIYLNLGWLGVLLLVILLVTCYKRTLKAVFEESQAGSLRLAFFIIAVAYNFSEFGFKMMHPIWLMFLLSTAINPQISQTQALEADTQLEKEHSDNRVKDLIANRRARSWRLSSRQSS